MTIRITEAEADREERSDGRVCKCTRQCRLCGEDVSVYVRVEDFDTFLRRSGYVQNIFPYLTADERELLAHGFCGPCFDKACPPDEE